MTRAGFVLILLLPLLAGCALFESKATRAMRASPDFRAGYGDGCASANNGSANPRADTMLRDDNAYQLNGPYRLGWNEGFGACRGMANQSTRRATDPLGGMPMPPR